MSTPELIADMKQQLASLDGYSLDIKGESFPVGDWCHNALSYMAQLERIIVAQNAMLSTCYRPVTINQG